MKKRIHFNNAGTGIMSKKTIDIIHRFHINEKKTGGYEFESLQQKKLDSFYKNVGKLLNCNEKNISYLQSSTLAWNFCFFSIPLVKENNIVILENEYSSNHISILKRKNEFKELRIVKVNSYGEVSINDILKKIDKNTKILCLTHISSQNGSVIDIENISRICKEKFPNIVIILDCCQSAGQINIDIKKIRCDALVASGRKYLCGPRGTGFLFLSTNLKEKMIPILEDMNSSKIMSEKKVEIKKNIRLFETYENSKSLKIGFSNAVDEVLCKDITKIRKKILRLSSYLREKLFTYKEIHFIESNQNLSGINTFYHTKFKSEFILKFLKTKGINVNLSSQDTSFLFFRKIKKKSLVRLSLNHYNTFKEIDYFIEQINMLKN